MDEAVAQVSALVVDCADPDPLALFWRSLLGGDIVPYPDLGVVALRAPGVTFDFVRTGDRKEHKNRWHLDLASTNPAATVASALEVGASRADDVCISEHFTVLRDPEDNEFCVLENAPTGLPATRFARFLETTDDPGDLFSPDVFCDFNVPRWRYQLQGVEELADEIRHAGPNSIAVRRVEPTPSGVVLEAEIGVRIDGQPYYERTIWLVTINEDRIEEITLYCSGEWDVETRAQQRREARMLRSEPPVVADLHAEDATLTRRTARWAARFMPPTGVRRGPPSRALGPALLGTET